MVILRSEIWLINLEPTLGSEMSKLRPCVIVSPDEANKHLHTVIAAPLTSTLKIIPQGFHVFSKERKDKLQLINFVP